MKTLEQLNYVDSASLLFQLFPEEIPALVEYIDGMCNAILEDEQRNRQQWNNKLYTFDLWLSLAKEAQAKIGSYRTKLCKDKRLFSQQLFEGYIGGFSSYCITVHISTAQHRNPKFTLAVQLLFD